MVAVLDVTLDGDSFGAQLPGDRSGGPCPPARASWTRTTQPAMTSGTLPASTPAFHATARRQQHQTEILRARRRNAWRRPGRARSWPGYRSACCPLPVTSSRMGRLNALARPYDVPDLIARHRASRHCAWAGSESVRRRALVNRGSACLDAAAAQVGAVGRGGAGTGSDSCAHPVRTRSVAAGRRELRPA